MIAEAQIATVDLLAGTAAYEEIPEAAGEEVSRVDTHISHLFLVGGRAFKLKRAVKLPYLDFSTPAARRRGCEAEVALNRRTAPAMYLGIRPVLGSTDGHLRLGSLGEGGAATDGDIVDWVVEMTRFDQSRLFDRMAARGALGIELIEDLAGAIAAFHQAWEPMPDFGGRGAIETVVTGNAKILGSEAGNIFDSGRLASLEALSHTALAHHGELLDLRRATGWVRRCHGDLHLGNIFLGGTEATLGRPVMFDAIEFNDQISCIDTLYDFAFLLMDLDHRGLRAAANAAFNRYQGIIGDFGGLPLLPLFLSLRAAIRAHVTAARARATGLEPVPARGHRAAVVGGLGAEDAAMSLTASDEARAYLDHALSYLSPPSPRLIGLGGFSGSGKSRLARRLAPAIGAAPGALVIRSDVVRKRLAGVDADMQLPDDAYSSAMSRRVYDEMAAAAKSALNAGYSVIADAVHARPEQRRRLAAVAADTGAAFAGLWAEAPREIMADRIAHRSGDASDATIAVLRRQIDCDLGEMAWQRLDSSGAEACTTTKARWILHC